MAGFSSADLNKNLSDFATASADEIKAVRTLLNGNKRTLSLLKTTSRANLVAAINVIFDLTNTPISLEAVEIAVNDYFVMHPQSFDYEKIEPAAIWTIVHPLDHNPSVVVTDSAGTVWWGEVSYPEQNKVQIRFNFPLAGKAHLS